MSSKLEWYANDAGQRVCIMRNTFSRSSSHKWIIRYDDGTGYGPEMDAKDSRPTARFYLKLRGFHPVS